MSRNLSLNEFNILMPLVEDCIDREIEMPEFFESIEDDGKINEDTNKFKFFTLIKDENIKKFSADNCIIQ